MSHQKKNWFPRRKYNPVEHIRKRKLSEDDSDSDDEDMSSQMVRCVSNHIYFNAPVTDQTVGKLVEIIEKKNFELSMIKAHELVGDISPAPLYLHINSDGGILFSAMTAIDAIERSEIPIDTVVDGRAVSAGSLISVCGRKRYMTRNSYMLIHQLRAGTIGKFAEIKDEFENCDRIMKKIIDIYAEKTTMNRKQLTTYLSRDQYWDRDTCLKYGLVDHPWEDTMSKRDEPQPAIIDLGQLLAAATSGKGSISSVGGKSADGTSQRDDNADRRKRRRHDTEREPYDLRPRE